MISLDTKSNSSARYPFGYYRVGTEIHENKISALISATRQKVVPTWHFHTDVYESLDWQKDLPVDLNTVYQMRAKQLRERYDYLALSFSGGSDSWTALQSFIDSGTHLDEIFVRWPVKATDYWHRVNQQNIHASNILSEWRLTILPMLERYRQIIPQTRIVVHDWSDRLDGEITDQDWIYSNDYLNPGSFAKFQSVSDEFKDQINRGKKAALIFGSDKPQICYHDSKIYCYFLDHFANSHCLGPYEKFSELFYWTPDLPEITLVQARAIYNSIKSDKNLLQLIEWNQPWSGERSNQWANFSRSVIYPSYVKLNTFQALKGSSKVFDQVDDWMQKLKHERYYQSWQNGFNNLVNSIDDRFFNRRHSEIIAFGGYIDGMHLLGPAVLVDQ